MTTPNLDPTLRRYLEEKEDEEELRRTPRPPAEGEIVRPSVAATVVSRPGDTELLRQVRAAAKPTATPTPTAPPAPPPPPEPMRIEQAPLAPEEQAAVERGELGGPPTGPTITQIGIAPAAPAAAAAVGAVEASEFVRREAGVPIAEALLTPKGLFQEGLRKAGAPEWMVRAASSPADWAGLSERQQAEILSYVTTPENAVFFPSQTLRAVRAVGRGALRAVEATETGARVSLAARGLARVAGAEEVVERTGGLISRPAAVADNEQQLVEELLRASNAETAARETVAATRAAGAGVGPPEGPFLASRGLEPPTDPLALVQGYLDSPSKLGSRIVQLFDGALKVRAADADEVKRALEKLARDTGFPLKKNATSEEHVNFILALHDEAPRESFPRQWDELFDALIARRGAQEEYIRAVDPDFAEKGFVEWYWPRQFEVPGRRGVAGGHLRPGQRPTFMRARTRESLLETLLDPEKPLDLKTWNPIDQWFLRELDALRYGEGQIVLQRARASNFLHRGRDAPEGWVVPEGIPAFQSRPVPGRPDIFTPPTYVDPKLANALKAGPWARSAFDSGVLRAGRDLVADFKKTKVIGGVFQHIDYTIRLISRSVGEIAATPVKAVVHRDPSILYKGPWAALNHAGGLPRALTRAFIPGMERRFAAADLRNPIRRLALERDLAVDAGRDIVADSMRLALQQGADRLGAFPFIGRARWPGKVGMGRVQKVLNGAFDFVTSGTYRRFHAEMIHSINEMNAKAYMRAGLPFEEAVERAVLDSHIMMSSIPAWQSWFKSKMARDLINTAALFSQQESQGWIRSFFRIFGPKTAGQFATQWLGIALTTVGFADLIQYWRTGEHLRPDQLVPWRASTVPGTATKVIGFNSYFLRPELGVEGPEGRKLLGDLLGQGDTPLRWFLDPTFALKSRLQVTTTTSLALLQGRDPFSGQPLSTTRPTIGGVEIPVPLPGGEALKFIGRELAIPIPFAAWFEERRRIGTQGALLQMAGINISSERRSDLRDRLARAENPNNETIQEHGYRGLTTRQRRDFENRHPEITAASERDVREAAAKGEEWAEYLVGQMDAENTFNAALNKIGDVPNAARRNELLKLARAAYASQLAKNNLAHPDMVEAFSSREPLPGLETNRRELMDIYSRHADPETGLIFDTDALYEEIDEWEASKTPQELEELYDNMGVDRPEWYQQRQEWGRTLDREFGWWDVADMRWEDHVKDGPYQGTSWDEFEQSVIQGMVESGKEVNSVSLRDAFIRADPNYRDHERALRQTKENMRRQFPRLEALLLAMGYVGRPLTEEARRLFKEMTGREAPRVAD